MGGRVHVFVVTGARGVTEVSPGSCVEGGNDAVELGDDVADGIAGHCEERGGCIRVG